MPFPGVSHHMGVPAQENSGLKTGRHKYACEQNVLSFTESFKIMQKRKSTLPFYFCKQITRNLVAKHSTNFSSPESTPQESKAGSPGEDQAPLEQWLSACWRSESPLTSEVVGRIHLLEGLGAKLLLATTRNSSQLKKAAWGSLLVDLLLTT